MNIFAREMTTGLYEWRTYNKKEKKKKKNQKSPRMDPDALQQTTAWPMAVHPESTESTKSPRAVCRSG